MILILGKNKFLAQRYFSNVIDYSIYLGLVAICIYTLGETNDAGGFSLTGPKALAMPLLWILYFPVCESVFRQTFGKKVFHLYVIDSRGESASIVQTFLRHVLDFFELMFMGLPSLLSINYSDKNLRIGDRMADTRVISPFAACRFCGVELELTSKEVVNNMFICPKCGEVN